MALGRCNTGGSDKYVNAFDLENYSLSSFSDLPGLNKVNLAGGYKIGEYIYYYGNFYKEDGQVITMVPGKGDSAPISKDFTIVCGKYLVFDASAGGIYIYKYIVNLDTLSTIQLKVNNGRDLTDNQWPKGSIKQYIDVESKKLYVFYSGKRYEYDLYGDGTCLEIVALNPATVGANPYYCSVDKEHFYIFNNKTLQKVKISDLSVVNSIEMEYSVEIVVTENEYMYVWFGSSYPYIRVINLLTMQVVKDISFPKPVFLSYASTTKDYVCFYDIDYFVIIDKKSNTLVDFLYNKPASTSQYMNYALFGDYNIFRNTSTLEIFPYKFKFKE